MAFKHETNCLGYFKNVNTLLGGIFSSKCLQYRLFFKSKSRALCALRRATLMRTCIAFYARARAS